MAALLLLPSARIRANSSKLRAAAAMVCESWESAALHAPTLHATVALQLPHSFVLLGEQALQTETEGVTGSQQNWRRGETKEGAAQMGATGRQEERLKGPRAQAAGAAWPQGLKPATKSLLQGAALERLIKLISASNAKKQQSNKPPRGQTGPSREATPKGPSAYRKQNASNYWGSDVLQGNLC